MQIEVTITSHGGTIEATHTLDHAAARAIKEAWDGNLPRFLDDETYDTAESLLTDLEAVTSR